MAAPVTPQYPQNTFPQYWTNGRKDIGIYGNNYLPGRYFSSRDMNFLGSINAELVGDIIECVIQLFKVAVSETRVNIYGEATSETGKAFYPAINMTALIQREDITGDDNQGFGPDRNQSVVYKFRERDCIVTGFFPEIGDVLLYNERFYEIDNVIQEQFLGGHPDKSWSFICNTHYSRLSKLNVVERQT
jgi:hypothetical protein|tara:strand:+ start:3503 stop:4069 length:567 start_codon:yes stop_codon:yes gene_type:complete